MIENINRTVSVVVLTYNSSAYVIETLDSIKAQDYPCIELVVSDDGSNDDTYEKVKQWIEANKTYFYNTIIVRSYKNMGTSHNYNQGVANSNGEFIKTIDGDDCLNGTHSISEYVEFMEGNSHHICISDVELFTADDMDLAHERKWYDYLFSCVCEKYEEQKKRIVKELGIPNPGLFFSRELFDTVQGFDEAYRLMEEWPFFLNVLFSGYRIYPLPKKLVRYRLVKKSVSHNKKSVAFKILQKDLITFFFRKRLFLLLQNGMIKDALYQLYKFPKNYIKSLIQ